MLAIISSKTLKMPTPYCQKLPQLHVFSKHCEMPPPLQLPEPPVRNKRCVGALGCWQGWRRVLAPSATWAALAAEVFPGQDGLWDRVAVQPLSISGCCHSDTGVISVSKEPINK